jgi:CRP-like cAMP-binding protein
MSVEYKVTSEYFFPLFAGDLFCDLKPGSSAAFAKIKQTKQFQKGACIFLRGDAARRIYILRAGKAQLLLNEEFKNKRIARVIEPNEILGVTEAIVNLPYETDAETIAPCTCEFIDRDDFIRFLQNETELRLRLVRLLATNLQKSRQIFFSSIN